MVKIMSDVKVDAERIKRLIATRDKNVALAKKPVVKWPKYRTSAEGGGKDATSIKGKVVDDSEIGDKKVLGYSGAADKIVYMHMRGGGGGSTGGGGDMTKAVYDTNDDGIVDNSEKLEGSTKAEVQNHAPQAHTHPCSDLTDHDKAAHDALNIDADTVDGVHASGFFAGTWATGSCSGSNPITTAHGLGGVPSLVLFAINAIQPYVASYNADATNITFYHNAAGSLTIKWAARL